MTLTASPLDRLAPDNVIDIDLGGDHLRQNWKTILPDWAKRPPIYIVNNGIPQVVCSRYADAQEVFTDRDRFSVVVPKAPGNERFDLFMGTKDIAHMDGADHDRARALLTPAFAPAALKKLEDSISVTVGNLLDEIEAQGDEFEAMSQFCSHLISRIVLDGMFHMSPERQRAFMRMHQAFALTIGIKPGDPFPAEYVEAFAGARAVINEMVEERRVNPGDDIISALANARDNGHALSDEELFGNIFAISAASLGTTANAMGSVLICLCSHPDQFAELRREPELIPQAVEEALRFGIGLLSFTRFATCDTEVGGTRIWKNMPVHVSRQGAALDPVEYPDPLRFDIRRDPKRLLVFGTGPHHCVGFRLGRQIVRRSLQGFIERFPDLRFADPAFKPVYGGMFGELKPLSIPLRIH